MTISVCIVNWNTREHLRKCLAALLKSETRHDIEIIVVDNASDDRTAEMVRESFTDIILIENEENLFYAAANNQAVQASTGEFVLFLNPDVVLPEEGLQALCDFLDVKKDAAAVAPRLILPDGAVQRSVRGFPGPWEVVCETTLLSRLFPKSRLFARYWLPDFNYDEIRRVDQPMASCLLFRREELVRLGGFDMSFPMFFNDVDLCYRLREAGGAIYFLPKVEVQHYHGASTRQVWRDMTRESTRGLLQFYRKHYRAKLSPITYGLMVTLIRVGGFLKWLLAIRPRS